MGKHLSQYLEQLESELDASLGADQLDDLLQEVRVHLIDSSEDFKSNGLSEDAAEEAAIQHFGTVNALALSLAKGRKTGGRLHWNLTALMIATITTLCVAVAYPADVLFPQDMSLPAVAAVSLALVLYALASHRGQGFRPLAYAGIVLGVLTVEGLYVGTQHYDLGSESARPIPVELAPNVDRAIGERLKRWNDDIFWLREGQSAFAMTNANEIHPEFRRGDKFVYPGKSMSASVERESQPLVSSLGSFPRVTRLETSDFELAKRVWAENAHVRALVLETKIATAERELARLHAAMKVPSWARAALVMVEGLPVAILWFLVLWLAHGVGKLFTRLDFVFSRRSITFGEI